MSTEPQNVKPPTTDPHLPPQHATWDEWSDADFDIARVHDQTSLTQEVACYLFGKMALEGLFTRQQLEPERVGFVLDALIAGLDEAVNGATFGTITSFEEVKDFADRGMMHRRKRDEQDGAHE